eukprot:6942028-Alexandrium_andersonii.AAC.1
MAGSCCRGSKAAGVAFRVHFKGDQEVVTDRVLLRRSNQLEVLEPKERPINATVTSPASARARRSDPQPKSVCPHHRVAL